MCSLALQFLEQGISFGFGQNPFSNERNQKVAQNVPVFRRQGAIGLQRALDTPGVVTYCGGEKSQVEFLIEFYLSSFIMD